MKNRAEIKVNNLALNAELHEIKVKIVITNVPLLKRNSGKNDCSNNN